MVMRTVKFYCFRAGQRKGIEHLKEKDAAAATIGHLKGAAVGTAQKAMDLRTGKKEVANERLSKTRKATKVSRM